MGPGVAETGKKGEAEKMTARQWIGMIGLAVIIVILVVAKWSLETSVVNDASCDDKIGFAFRCGMWYGMADAMSAEPSDAKAKEIARVIHERMEDKGCGSLYSNRGR